MKKVLNIFLLILIIILLALNIRTTYQETAKIIKIKKLIPYQDIGGQYLALREFIKNERSVGYLTNKDLKEAKANANFSQAQYILAPTILRINETNHRYLILNYTHPELALKKLAELKATPLKANNFGIILAERKQ